jgi:hypothetical protein
LEIQTIGIGNNREDLVHGLERKCKQMDRIR